MRGILHHYGPLTRAFADMQREVAPYVEKRGIRRLTLSYEGASCAPFTAYTRWQPGRVTVADINAVGMRRQDRMGPICDALEALGLTVRWESVANEHICDWLLRRGYEGQQFGDLILGAKQKIH